MRVGGRRSGRSRYRPDPWALPEWLVTGCGVVAATAVFIDVHRSPADFYLASVTDPPPVPLLAVAGILVGALPAFLSPPLPTVTAPSSPPGPVRDDAAAQPEVAA